jgi:hypothetical protein
LYFGCPWRRLSSRRSRLSRSRIIQASWKRSKRCSCSSVRPCAGGARATANPGPPLHQQLLLLAIRLEVDRGHDLIADQDRQVIAWDLPSVPDMGGM